MSDTIADASALINLVASGEASELTAKLQLIVLPIVARESLFVYSDLSRQNTTMVDRSELKRQGLNVAYSQRMEAESDLFVSLAAEIDDGEAEALAAAATRSLPLLSDDNAAIKRAAGLGVQVITTLDLLKAWSTTVSPAKLKDAAVSLRLRGNFAPPRGSPFRSWYSALISTP